MISGGGLQDYRSLSIEVLRDFARTRSEITSLRAVADEVGISCSTIHKFVLGRTMPQPRVKRLLGLWYLAKQNEVEDIDIVRPYFAALSVLLAEIPEAEQDAARGESVTLLQCVYEGRAPTPRWLELLLHLSDPGR